MKIMDIPTFGPMFRFSDANVYYALYLLSDGTRMGRKALAEASGVGEGSMRRILEKFREWNFVDIKQTGISITKAGLAFLDQIPIRLVDVDIAGSVMGAYQQGVIVYGVASKIGNGMKQRDAGVRSGAVGCTTILMVDGHLMIPPDWDMDEKTPEIAAKIRKDIEMTQDDVIIVGDAESKIIAIEAAINAAFDLI